MTIPNDLKEIPSVDYEVEPQCSEAFSLFCTISTQWRVSTYAFIGLDYNPLFSLMDRRGIESNRQVDLIDEISQIERGALSVLNKK